MMINLKSIAIGISTVSVGIIVSYFLFQKKTSRLKKKYCTEITIPNACVPHILGKYGCVVKALREQCFVVVRFLVPGLLCDETTCIVEGDHKNVELGASIIKNIITNYHRKQKNGGIDAVEDLYQLEKDNYTEEGAQLFSAILRIVSSSDEAMHGSNSTKENDYIPSQGDKVNHKSQYPDHTLQIQPVGGDNLIPIYVSAVATPELFWVQLTKTKEHAELDQLTDVLEDFYSFNSEINIPPEYESVQIGNLYATYIEEDSRWYRAEVVQIFAEDDKNVLDTKLDLFFLDYGESYYQKLRNIRIIPKDLLELKFQAVACSLADIKSKGDEWSEEAIKYFEELTHSAQWYTLHARVEYKSEKNSSNDIPYITLVDTNSNDLNINEEMVNSGFAEFTN